MGEGKNWMDAWLESQQGYWKAWAEMARRGTGQPEAHKPPLADGLDQWWRAVAPMTPPAGREVFEKVMAASKGYYALAERFLAGAGEPDGGMAAVNAWLDGMQGLWRDWGQAMPRAGEGLPDLAGLWGQSLAAWNRMAASVMPQGAGGDAVLDSWRSLLALPAVGYTREAQAGMQALARCQADYLEALRAYQAAFAKLSAEATRSFQDALRARAQAGQPISSLRELYDQWVELSEAAHAGFVMTPEYQALYGRLVNSLLAYKRQATRITDQALAAFNLPTRAELDTLLERQHELRRENRRLRNEINEIRSMVEAVRQVEAPAEPAPARAKPARKTATRKTGAAQ